ncbi:putative baseplate assembly protein [Streptomycetaceae bacterium NBC_01309]
MNLPTPNLDDRRFQGLVDDAKRLVQRRCPEWTDHNVSDPGVTLIEAFAGMVDELVYRLNRVPDKNYLAFLDLIGVRLHPPTAARAKVTFRLSAPQPETVRVRGGAEVATVRTETDEAVVFTTVADLAVVPCSLAHLATRTAAGAEVDRTDELALARDVPCFDTTPAPGDALYVGLASAVPSCVVALRLDCRVEGVGVDPRRPPFVWEAWDGAAWAECEVEADGTGGLNRPGEIILHLPPAHAVSTVARTAAGWLRCRLVEAVPGQPVYIAPPTVRELVAFTIGGSVDAVHAEVVEDEILGLSEGVPGQFFEVARPPVVPGDEPFVVDIGDGSGWAAWQRVDDFAHSGPADRHFTLTPGNGRVEFGPAVRQADGSIRHHGAVPPKGSPIRIREYRTGGGRRGNVAAGAVRVMRTSIPFVSRVTNRGPALGGVDGETVENAKVRGPMTLRTLHRAVVPHDYEELAREAAPDIARVNCVPAGDSAAHAGGVRLLVIPAAPDDGGGRLRFADLVPPEPTLRQIAAHLEERRPIGARLVVQPPFYQGVTVVATVQATAGAAGDRMRAEALAALYRYFNPLTGGPAGDGWPFGRPVQAGEVYAVLQNVPGIDLVQDVRLFAADPVTGERRAEAVNRIELSPHALVFSYGHQLRVRGS